MFAEKKEGEIAAEAVSCKINTPDQCFINKKMSYFTCLCGPLSPGRMMECQIISRSSTFGPPIEGAPCLPASRRPLLERAGCRRPVISGSSFRGGLSPPSSSRSLRAAGRPADPPSRAAFIITLRRRLTSGGPEGGPRDTEMAVGLRSLRKAPDGCRAARRGVAPRKTVSTSRSNVL